jgi:hypothetical protein
VFSHSPVAFDGIGMIFAIITFIMLFIRPNEGK